MKQRIAMTLSLLLLLANFSPLALARNEEQSGTVEVHGIVTDEQNAFIVAAPVVLEDAQGKKFNVTTDDKGRYKISGLKPGIYTLTVEVEGFAKFVQPLDLSNKRSFDFNVPLKVFISENVEVKNDTAGISTEPDKNLSATVLTPKELEALPDDPDDLLDTLKQMAGPGEASVYVNGFGERGRIPAKESIQQIKINSNPFSAEFSEQGSMRIEIITKPGSDTYHGSMRFNFNDDILNARQATATTKAPFQARNYSGSFTGPIIRNRWGFSLDMDRREVDDNAYVNAITLPLSSLIATPFSTTVLQPTRSTNFSIRSEYLLSKKHTIGVQYRYNERRQQNQEVGNFDLPERAATTFAKDNTVRFSLTTIASEHAVNEFRLQINRRSSGSSALNRAPAIIVSEAFNAGGNQGSLFADNSTDGLEATNDVTYTWGKHTVKTGFRAEAAKLNNLNQANFGGTFTFGSDFERDASGRPLDANGQVIDPTNPNAVPVPISSLELYRRVVTNTPGYRASQFSINRGDPFIGFTQWEMGIYAQDDWRISPGLSLSYGIRQEFQTHLQDKWNIAPRFALAWVPDKAKKSTLRVGGGIFYSRLDSGITSSTIRSDGIHQQNVVITRPDFFPTIPSALNSATNGRITTRIKDANLKAPYQSLAQVSYERQLPLKLAGSITYTYSHGADLFRSRNINAPVNGVKPQPEQGAILVYESTGKSNRNELRFSLRTNFSRKFTLFGTYVFAHTKSDTDGAGTSPANPYDLSIEYGRSSFDIRHTVFVGGSVLLPWNVRLNPFVHILSGRPFNITTGRDNNLDTIFTDRPAFANVGAPGAIVTPYGVFNPNPRAGEQIIPRNFGDGPGQVSVSLGISKTFGFGPPIGSFPGMSANSSNNGGNTQQPNQSGNTPQPNQSGNTPRNNQGGNNNQSNSAMGQAMNQVGSMMARGGGGPGGHGGGGFSGGGMRGGMFGDSRTKYNLTLDVRANNLLNHTNFNFFNGVLTSPFFGRANLSGQPRRIEASIRFSF
ncbi:MAG: TonB-dependent receptor [Acidobacteria bacterium]|nr:TonB-dependent receptor [Acidobacteriota bacterium]